MFKKIDQKGQALLIVVLAMVVALTVGLAVVSRSIINLRNSQQEISSQQALSAAEAGIEQSILVGAGISNGEFSSTNTTFNTTVNTISGASDFLLNGNNRVSQDDAMYIWLTPYSSDTNQLFQTTWTGDLNLYWGDSSTACNNAALEIAVIYGTREAPQVSRSVYDPCAARVSRNNFTQAAFLVNKTILDIPLFSSTTNPIHITNGFLVRVVPLYLDAHIGVSKGAGSPDLPSQGKIITSTGVANNNIQRRLDVFQGYPELPAELFPFSLFWP